MHITLTALAAAIIGGAFGLWQRHTAALLTYRLDAEADLPAPGRRSWIVWTAAITFTGLGAWAAATASWPLLPAILPLAAVGPLLAAIDLDVQRLPNRILAPIAGLTMAGVASTLITLDGPTSAISAAAGGLVTGTIFALLHLVSRGGIGFGDVKLSAVIGMAVGSVGFPSLLWAILLACLCAAVWAIVTHQRGPFPFGPWLLAGAWLGVLTTLLAASL